MITIRHTGLALASLFASAVLLGGVAAHGESVLNRGNGAEPETLDPQKLTGVPEGNIAYDLYEGLTTLDANGNPTGGVAKSWAVSDDGKTYTFQLRDDAKWSNGDPITADDVVYSFHRIVDPKVAAEYAYIYSPIVNADDISNGKEPDLNKLGVVAVDAHTVMISLKAPTPYLIGLLAHPSAEIVNRKAVEKFGDQWTRPGNNISSGAYILAEWTPQSRIVLVKNPMFHDAANVKIDKVIMYPTEDIAEEYKRFKADELDVTATVPSERIAEAASEYKNEFSDSAYFGTYFYAINMTKDPLGKNLALRDALSMAIDRDALTKKITRAAKFLPIPGCRPACRVTSSKSSFAGMPMAERLAKAKQIFKDAGYGPDHPLQIEILYNTSENHKKIAIAIASMWKALGCRSS